MDLPTSRPGSEGAQVFLNQVLSAQTRTRARARTHTHTHTHTFSSSKEVSTERSQGKIQSLPILQCRVRLQSQASISVCNLGHSDNRGGPFNSRSCDQEGVTRSGAPICRRNGKRRRAGGWKLRGHQLESLKAHRWRSQIISATQELGKNSGEFPELCAPAYTHTGSDALTHTHSHLLQKLPVN